MLTFFKKHVVFLLAILVVITLWVLNGYLLYDCSDKNETGGMFGAVNALFSGLAFAGLIYAVKLQIDELGLQRIELQSTRMEMEGQKKQLENQNYSMEVQRFGNFFFAMIEQKRAILSAAVEEKTKINERRGVFEPTDERTTIQSEFSKYLKAKNRSPSELHHPDWTLLFQIYNFYKNILDHLDRLLNLGDQELYVNTLKGFMYDIEAYVVAEFVIALDDERTKVLLEKFAMFELLSAREDFSQFKKFSPKVFGKNEIAIKLWGNINKTV